MIYRCRGYYLCFVNMVQYRNTRKRNTELRIIYSSNIYFQASYETLYHSYLSTNKAESLGSSSSGPGEAVVDRTGEVMQAILQVETNKRTCVIM